MPAGKRQTSTCRSKKKEVQVVVLRDAGNDWDVDLRLAEGGKQGGREGGRD